MKKAPVFVRFLPYLLSAFLSLAASSLAATAARADYQLLIENGTVIDRQDSLTRTVPLLQLKGGAHCSSSFLSARTILTAGHCIENRRAADVTVAVQNSNGSWEQKVAKSVALHPQFSHRVRGDQHIFRFDLAIVQLEAPFSFAVNAITIGEPGPTMARGSWEAVTDVGYGWSQPKTGDKILRRGSMNGRVTNVPAFDNRAGLEQNKNAANQNACPGDSGGAVFLGGPSSRKQIAVHSMADGCTAQSRVTYSELLWPARAWLQAQIR